MKILWVDNESPNMWILGITSVLQKKRSYALHFGAWSLMFIAEGWERTFRNG